MLDALPVAVVAVDADGAPVHLNATALELLAAPSGDPDRERLRAAIRLEGGEGEDVVALALHVSRPISVPVRVVTHRGVLRRRALLSRWGAGAIVAFRGLVAGSDAATDDDSAHLEALLANTSDIITVLEADGRIRYSNAAAGRLTGYDGAVVNGTQVIDLVHPDDRPKVEAAFAAAVATPGMSDPVVVRIRFADGSWHVVEAIVNNLVDDTGVHGLVVTGRDITRQVLDEQRFRSLIANLTDVIVVLDDELRVSFASPGIEDLLGDPAESNVGSRATRDIHPEDTPHIVEVLTESRRRPGERLEAELRIRHVSGRWRRVLGTAVNLLDDPSVAGIVCTLRDVTEERDAVERLQELSRLKDQFLTTVSHELRTPLAAINGFTELLATGELADGERDEVVRRLARNASELHGMVDRLLDHAKVMAGDVALETRPVDVREAVDAAVESLAWALREHSVSVVVGPGLRVGADPDCLGHVLRNLLGNAAKFSPPGSRVTVTATAEGPEVTISVADQGPGIPADVGDRVFEPFFQLDPAASGRRGTGVGLAIARRYTELQGGRIGVRSTPGAGSTFWVSLPGAG